MKKAARYIGFSFFLVLILFIGYLKINPPLAYGSIGTTSDKQSVIVPLGNKSVFGTIHILQISINGSETPTNMRVQTGHTSAGFMMTDLLHTNQGQEDYESIILAPNSSPVASDSENASGNSKTYGLSISEETPIERIDVSYRYLGLSFEKTIQL